jgi:hypothetical protein
MKLFCGMPRYLNTRWLWKNSNFAAFYAAFLRGEPKNSTKDGPEKMFGVQKPHFTCIS